MFEGLGFSVPLIMKAPFSMSGQAARLIWVALTPSLVPMAPLHGQPTQRLLAARGSKRGR